MRDSNLRSEEIILKEIEKLRKLLHSYHDLIENGKVDGEVLLASEELDKLIVEYQLKIYRKQL